MTVLREIKGMPKSEKALEYLERLMKHTAPMVARHGWNLRELKEFYPNQAGLLGLNMNRSVICVRLRRAGNKEHFLEWHDMLGTMVHELTHMKISAHSAEFYSLMDSLYTEVEKDEESGLIHRFDGSKDMAKGGIPASGGKILGGSSSTGVLAKPKSRKDIANERALAAERRRKEQGIMGSGIVGTSSSSPGFSRKPRFDLTTNEGRRKAMAWAAERRLSDNIACPAESQELAASDFKEGSALGEREGEQVVSVQKRAPGLSSKRSIKIVDLANGENQKRKGKPSSPSSSSSSASSGGGGHVAKKRPKIIDLTDTTPPNSQSDVPQAGSSSSSSSSSRSSSSSNSSGAATASVEEASMGAGAGEWCAGDEDPYLRWACPICTFINPEEGATTACSMCSFRRQESLPVPADHVSSSSYSSSRDPLDGARAEKEDKKQAFDPFKAQVSSGHHAWRGGGV